MEKKRVCTFFLKNSCNKGDKCNFLHSNNNNFNQKNNKSGNGYNRNDNKFNHNKNNNEKFNNNNNNRDNNNNNNNNYNNNYNHGNKFRGNHNNNDNEKFNNGGYNNYNNTNNYKPNYNNQPKNNDPNLIIKSINRKLEELNRRRKEMQISFINVKNIHLFNNYVIFIIDKMKYCFLYDLSNDQFYNEQIFLNKKIETFVQNSYLGQFGNLGEFIGFTFNYFNEIELKRKSCICLKQTSNLMHDSEDIILFVTDVSSINYLYFNKNILFASYSNGNNSKYVIYNLQALNNLKEQNITALVNLLDTSKVEYEINGVIETIECIENLYFK